MNPLEAPLQAVRAALAAEDIDEYHEARDDFNEAAAAMFRIIRNSRN